MAATTTVDHQIPQVCEVVSPTRSQATSQVGFFTRWSSRAPIAPPVTPSTALSISSAVATSNTATTYRDSCDRCEELKIQSDINQSMLNECATGLKAREAEVGALKELNRELQVQLDSANQGNTQLSLEQVRFKRELQSKDNQLAGQVVESTLHANTCNELTAQLVQQYKVLADAHMQGKERADAVHTAHQQEVATIEAKLEAKDQELMCIKGELETQGAAGNKLESIFNEKIAELTDQLHRLNRGIEEEASKRAAELDSVRDEQFGDLIAKLRARIEELQAENTKLYAQLSAEDDLDFAPDNMEDIDTEFESSKAS